MLKFRIDRYIIDLSCCCFGSVLVARTADHSRVNVITGVGTGFRLYITQLYNNTCSFCIFIGRELCFIKVHTHG